MRAEGRVVCAMAAMAVVSVAGPVKAQDLEPGSGAYIANASGCTYCHTAPDGPPFAGGLVLHTPFGPLATPNITQDEATGIGNWTKDDFVNALHRGLNEDGQPLYPGMPYLHYTKMTDADVSALWDFVRTIPAVDNAVEVNRLPFPFDVRESLYVWRMLYFREGRFEPDSAKDDVWNRGAYLVEALGHCGACHTPRDALGGPETSRSLEGGRIEEWYAPDISNGPNSVIAGWDVARLEAFLAGNDGMNHVAVGSMRDVVDETQKLTKDDRHAIAVYLKDQKPTSDPAPGVSQATSQEIATGKEIFASHCVTCHGESGEGAPGVAASLVGSGAVLAGEADNVISVILEGIGPHGDFGVMPSFRDTLSDQEIADVTNYVRTAWGNNAPTDATVSHVAGLRNVTQADPRALAGATCPNVPADRISDDNRAAIKTIADQKALDASAIQTAVSAYRTHNPDASVTQTVVDLGGVYCQDLVKAGYGKTAVMTRQLAFMEQVTALVSQPK